MIQNLSSERQTVLDLHLDGLTPREIALELGLSVQRIYQQLKKLGVQPNPRKEERNDDPAA